MNTGTIFDIKKFAIHDGPGVRTTVFLKGCPLGCWLCHNPESQSFRPELMIRDGRCTRCGDCIEACAENAVSLNGNSVHIDRYRCDLCGACADVCLAEAIARGIRTAVDTCGHVAPDLFRSIAEHVDLFLYDLKIIDDQRHREFTGVGVESIHENLRWLAERGRAVIVRYPLLPGINDDEENIRAMGGFLTSLEDRPRVDILPYHRAGVDKYDRLGREARLPEIQAPSEELVAAVARRLEGSGLQVTVRGERV